MRKRVNKIDYSDKFYFFTKGSIQNHPKCVFTVTGFPLFPLLILCAIKNQ